MSKLKDWFSSAKVKLTALALSVAGALYGTNTFAAVDADVASTTASVVNTMKENVIGVITANISNIVIVGVIIFSIGFVWRLGKTVYEITAKEGGAIRSPFKK